MRVYVSVDMEGVAGVVHEDAATGVAPAHAQAAHAVLGDEGRQRGRQPRLQRLDTTSADAGAEDGVAGLVDVEGEHGVGPFEQGIQDGGRGLGRW